MKRHIGQLLALATILTTGNVVAAPPVVTCSGNQVIHCTSSNGAMAIVQAMVRDADGDDLLVIWQISPNTTLTNLLPQGVTTNIVLLSLTNALP